MENLLCWYANHWFISYILLVIIITQAAGAAGVPSETLNSVSAAVVYIITQICIVKGIGYFIGDKCLKIERDAYQRKTNILNAKLG